MRGRSILLVLSSFVFVASAIYLTTSASKAQQNDSGTGPIGSSPISTSVPANDASAPMPTPSLNPDINSESENNSEGLAAPTGEDYDTLIKKGVWRGGKAVPTDFLALDFLMNENLRRGYKPVQPINFNHQLHVEKNKMECQYCHSAVAKNAYATLPSVESCMGCHKQVKTDSPEIKKLTEYWNKGEPVPWEKVHKLPQHAHFSHKRHIKAGVGCQTCHGQIQKMPVVEKVASLKMGFCISCHRENGASIDCSVCHY